MIKPDSKKIHYAVVGLTEFAQQVVLPAFHNASENSLLVAIVDDSTEKLEFFGEKYQISKRYLYSELDQLLMQKQIDAVCICVPLIDQSYYIQKIISLGIHILCQTPLATTTEDALSIIEGVKRNNVHLMVENQIMFDPSFLEFNKIIQSKKIGEPILFNSNFIIPFHPIEFLNPTIGDEASSSLLNLGAHPIKLVRSFFKSDPMEVFCFSHKNQKNDLYSCVMQFPDGKMAQFNVGFGSFEANDYEIIGTKGRVRIEKGYLPQKMRTLKTYEVQKIIKKKFSRRNYFSNEISYFSDCVQKNKKNNFSAEESLTDLKIIDALFLSLDLSTPITLEEIHKKIKPMTKFKFPRPFFLKQ